MDPAKTVISLVTAGLVSLGTLSLTVTPALATVSVPPGAPVQVVVDAPTETFSVPVEATGIAQAQHAASLWITYPGQLQPQLIGSGTSTTEQVPLQATIDTTKLLLWGQLVVTATDDADGSATPVTLDVDGAAWRC